MIGREAAVANTALRSRAGDGVTPARSRSCGRREAMPSPVAG
ncbi:hypothetical protein [Azospirillum palustre]